jgi:predicted AAA+ superfamily ATPase
MRACPQGSQGSLQLAAQKGFKQPAANLAISRHPELPSTAMNMSRLYPRFAGERLKEALADTPVVLIHGPRQSGKTTLAQMVGEPSGFAYFSFDDRVLAGAAEADPIGFVDDLPDRAILDEVQRVPELFPALKVAVDRRRTPGRFLLTGSANVLLVPKLAESLAGRMEILRLHPLAQCELAEHAPRFLEVLFAGEFRMERVERLGSALVERLAAGGYPAALARPKPRRRAAWYRDYIEALVQRDVRDLARIRALDVLPRLLAFAAAQTAQLLNVSELAGPFQLSRPTVREYVTLLERVFLVEELPPWHVSRTSRLVKTPKLHLGDTGIACALLGLDAATLAKDRKTFGSLLETFVFQELRRQASWHEDDIRFHHFRDKDGFEVDIVLERGAHKLAGVEVKASATITAADFRGLRKLKDAAGDRFAAGAVLYDGETSVSFGDSLFAVPISALWETCVSSKLREAANSSS